MDSEARGKKSNSLHRKSNVTEMGMFAQKLDQIVSTEDCMEKRGEKKADGFHSVSMKVSKHSFKRQATIKEVDEYYDKFS